jgi:hypothetical protein
MPHQSTNAGQAIHDIDFHEPRSDRNLHKFAKTQTAIAAKRMMH